MKVSKLKEVRDHLKYVYNIVDDVLNPDEPNKRVLMDKTKHILEVLEEEINKEGPSTEDTLVIPMCEVCKEQGKTNFRVLAVIPEQSFLTRFARSHMQCSEGHKYDFKETDIKKSLEEMREEHKEVDTGVELIKE